MASQEREFKESDEARNTACQKHNEMSEELEVRY